MQIYITDVDIHQTMRLAIVKCANKLQLEDIDWKTNNELFEEMQLLKRPLFILLDNYLANYMAWATFIMANKDRTGFTSEESIKLHKLIGERDRTRNYLKDAINS